MRIKPAAKVTVVTVTYGRRLHLVRQVLASLPAQGVTKAIVVDNGSLDDIQSLQDEFQHWVEVVRVGQNIGSAGGFKTGMQHALKNGAEFIWLLDDDNVPEKDALNALLRAHLKLQSTAPVDEFALLSFRPDHQADLAAGIPLNRCYPRPGSFFGFHLSDLPYKLWRRTPMGRPRPPQLLPEFIRIPFAPYSGLLFHRSVLGRIGLPKEEMVLYADDTEFTSRLTRSGGGIFLITHSKIRDLETSWNTKSRFNSSLIGWLCGESDIRAFYGARNIAYFEAMTDQSIVRSLNKFIYFGIFIFFALTKKRWQRLVMLVDAVRCGESQLLGLDKRFPLKWQ